MKQQDNPTKDDCFQSLGAIGKVYDPMGTGQAEKKKHPCRDCGFCQQCSESRCVVCRAQRAKHMDPLRKLSIREQIALYEQLNRAETVDCCNKI